MTMFKGTVSKIFPARYGGSFGLEGERGLYFNTKQALPAYLVPGATVSFEAEVGRNGKSVYVSDATLKQEAAPAPARAGAGGTGGGGGTDWAEKDRAIRYQSARKDALAVVDLLLRNAAVKLPTKQALIAGAIESLVDRFTAIYYEDVEHLGALGRTEPEKESPKAPEREPDPDDLPE